MRRQRRRGERGNSESVQWALLTPLLALLVLGGIQTGIWLHGRTVVQQAAVGGAEAAALSGGTASQGETTARRLAADLSRVQVQVTAGADVVTVTVTGHTHTFVDLGQGEVRGSATVPREVRS